MQADTDVIDVLFFVARLRGPSVSESDDDGPQLRRGRRPCIRLSDCTFGLDFADISIPLDVLLFEDRLEGDVASSDLDRPADPCVSL